MCIRCWPACGEQAQTRTCFRGCLWRSQVILGSGRNRQKRPTLAQICAFSEQELTYAVAGIVGMVSSEFCLVDAMITPYSLD